jgi:hypothetical protein
MSSKRKLIFLSWLCLLPVFTVSAKDSFFLFKAGLGAQSEIKSQDSKQGVGVISDSNPEAIKIDDGKTFSLGLEYWQNRFVGLGFDYRKFRKRKTMSDLMGTSNDLNYYILGISGHYESIQLVLDLLVRFPLGKGAFTLFGGYGLVQGDAKLTHDTEFVDIVRSENLEEKGTRLRFGLEYFFGKDTGVRLNYLKYDTELEKVRSLAVDNKADFKYNEYLLELIYIFK